MTTHLVTFSDESMSRARRLCVESAKRHGVDSVYECGPSGPSNERGYGFWRWKPQIINNVLAGQEPFITSNDNDIVIYSDAGVEFINNVSHIIDRMDQDIFLFGNNWEHAHWCKRDVIDAIWPQPRPTNEERLARIVELERAGRTDILEAVDAILKGEVSEPVLHDILWNQFGKQCQASVIFFRVSDYSRKFVAEWLKWCLFEGGRLIDDSPSKLPNHPEFREHRHDQAILTTLAYREGLRLHYWPAMYNDGAFSYEKLPCYAEDDYPILFHHHRRRDHEWKQVA